MLAGTAYAKTKGFVTSATWAGLLPRMNLNAMKSGMVLVSIYEFTQQTYPVRTPRGKDMIVKERSTHPVRTPWKDMMAKKSDFYTPPIHF